MMQTLSGRVIRGGLWMVALTVTGRLLGIVRVLVLARLLTPHDFGLVGIALVVSSLLEAFSATGIQLTLIQRTEWRRDLLDTGWTLGLIRGIATAGIMVIVAPMVGGFFDAPQAVAIVRAMALVPLLGGLANIGVVELRRELTLGRFYLLHTSAAVADLGVAVALAFWLGNAWALVGGWLAQTAVRVTLTYVVHPYRPALRLDRDHVRELLGYGRWVFGTMISRWLLGSGVQAVVGRLLGVETLGLYQMAWRLACLPVTEMADAVSGVTVAAYAKLQTFPDRARLAYLRVLRVIAGLAIPLGVGIEVYAPGLVRFALGTRWEAAVPILRVLAIFGLVHAISATTEPLFQGMGAPRRQAVVGAARVACVASLLGPLTLWLGAQGAATAETAAVFAGALAAQRAVRGLLDVGPREMGPLLGWPLLACLPFVALRLAILAPPATAVGLAQALVLSALLYAGGLLLLDRLKLYRLPPILPPSVRDWLP